MPHCGSYVERHSDWAGESPSSRLGLASHESGLDACGRGALEVENVSL